MNSVLKLQFVRFVLKHIVRFDASGSLHLSWDQEKKYLASLIHGRRSPSTRKRKQNLLPLQAAIAGILYKWDSA